MMNSDENFVPNEQSDEKLGDDEFSFKPFQTRLEVDTATPPPPPNTNDQVDLPPTDNINAETESLQYQKTPSLASYIYPTPADGVNQKVNASTAVKQNMTRKYFGLKPGVFDHAVEDVKQYLKPTVDGNYLSSWLLAEIDHWDHEKERIVVLTDTLMIIIKYNFVATRIEDCQRVQLHMIDRIQGGRFQYPEKTMMIPRAFQTGIRISWNKNEVLTRWQRFSPFFNNPSYKTFTQHKAAIYMDTLPTHMVYEAFKAALIEAVQASGAIFEVVIEPIFLEVYVGAMSIVHNSSDLGYSKDRGSVSF